MDTGLFTRVLTLLAVVVASAAFTHTNFPKVVPVVMTKTVKQTTFIVCRAESGFDHGQDLIITPEGQWKLGDKSHLCGRIL